MDTDGAKPRIFKNNQLEVGSKQLANHGIEQCVGYLLTICLHTTVQPLDSGHFGGKILCPLQRGHPYLGGCYTSTTELVIFLCTNDESSLSRNDKFFFDSVYISSTQREKLVTKKS